MTTFSPFTIDDLILHDKVLDDYPFLSAQILNRWLRDGRIRCFKGKEGKTVYPKSDLSSALVREMECEETLGQEDFSNIEASGSGKSPAAPAIIDIGVRTEADELREELSMRSIFGEQKRSLSNSSAARRNQPKPHRKSV